MVSKAASFISERVGSDVEIARVDIGKFYNIKLEGIFIEGSMGRDTMLYVKSLQTRLATLRSLSEELYFDNIIVREGQFNLYVKDSTSNIKELIDRSQERFAAKKADKLSDSTATKPSFRLKISEIDVSDFIFRLENSVGGIASHGVDYQDMELRNIVLKADDFSIIDDSISMTVNSISLYEKGGVNIDRADMERLVVSGNGMNFDNGSFSINNNTYVDFNNIKLHYQAWEMGEYIDSVLMHVDVLESRVDMSTIALFTTAKREWKSIFEFEGSMTGTVATMEGNVKRATTANTTIENGNFYIYNVVDPDNSIFEISMDRLTTSGNDVLAILNDFATGDDITLPDVIEGDNQITIEGYLFGQLNNFDAECNITLGDNSGVITTNINLNSDQEEGAAINGTISADSVKTQHIFINKELEELSLGLDISGNFVKDNFSLNVDGNVSSLMFNDYNYNNIKLDGDINNRTFTGYVGCDDPNLDIKFNGMLDYNNIVPSYNFNLEVNRADLVAIGLNSKDSISIISGRLLADGNGDKIDNLNGSIMMDRLTYINDNDSIAARLPINILARNSEKSKYIHATSEYFDLTLRGVHSYSKLLDYIVKSSMRYIPSLELDKLVKSDIVYGNSEERGTANNSNLDDIYMIRLNVKRANNIASIFVPTLALAEGSNLSFLLNPTAESFSFSLNSNEVSLNNNVVKGININAQNEGNKISLFGTAGEIMAGSVYIPNFSIISNIARDSINLDFGFSNQEDNTYAIIRTSNHISRKDGELQYTVEFLPSNLSLYKDIWRSTGGRVIVENGSITIDNFSLTSTNQLLSIDGIISNDSNDSLEVIMDNFSFQPINLFSSSLGFDIEGTISGRIKASGLAKNNSVNIDADMSFADSVTVNGVHIPDTRFYTSRGSYNSKDFDFYFESGGVQYITGKVLRDNSIFTASVKIPQFDIKSVAPYLSSIAHDLEGKADVDVTVSNENKYLEINGEVNMPHLEATITETNVRYKLSGKALINDNQYSLVDGKVEDMFGGEGKVTAYMTNERYKKVKYNISINTPDIMALNTTERDNPLFYGEVYAAGNISINGDRNDIILDVNAQPSKQSTFILPLGENSLTEVSFIKFVERDTTTSKRTQLIKGISTTENSAEMQIRMNLRATPLLATEIIMDSSTGSSIKATGSGIMNINIEPSNEVFDINGEYLLDEGTYRFILPNFILLDKSFSIKDGSWMRWTGDPLDATINVDAIYSVKASLTPILEDNETVSEDNAYRKGSRVNVDCVLSLSGNLTQPDITLGVEVPDASPEERTAIKNVLNTQEAISTQIVYLLLSNSFYPANSGSDDLASQSATAIGIEFLTNQISNIFSTDKLNFGINYMPQNETEYTSSEVGIDLSAPIYGDKVFIDITGNYNFQDNSDVVNTEMVPISGDVYLTWVVNRSKSISLKAFTRTIDTLDENQGVQDSGVGAYFKLAFNTWDELMIRYKEYITRRRENRRERKAKSKEEVK